MKHASILDCTLRDGAYLLDKQFGDNTIRGIIGGLVEAHIDYIEIGFFQDDGFGEGRTVYLNSEQAKKYVPRDKATVQFTVLADCSRYSVDNLDEYNEDSIDAIRECFLKKEKIKAISNCKEIINKGYKCFIQPVDILGYSDDELIELLDEINKIEPYCFSIVDTFGSMYIEDLQHIWDIVDNHLDMSCKVGFHSHNNLQLSNALSQEFVRMSSERREIIIDSTISGMGRGAGNTPTELIAQYLVTKMRYSYDIDVILDIIDDYVDIIKTRCQWGYSTPLFVAGSYSAHVNNISYLVNKNSIRSRDIRYILNRIGKDARKRYDYSLLEQTYIDYLESSIDDTVVMKMLKDVYCGRNVLILAPGNTVASEEGVIRRYVNNHKPIIISVNFIPKSFHCDYVFMSNYRRYSILKESETYKRSKKIITSNIKQIAEDESELIVSFNNLISCGWKHLDNSTLMLLRLLDKLSLNNIGIAGFDGYSNVMGDKNYAIDELEIANVRDNPDVLNEEIENMLAEYICNRESSSELLFVTTTKYSNCILFE